MPEDAVVQCGAHHLTLTDPEHRPGRLLRWGLPRDPAAMRHLSGFVVSAVATILVTRGLLAATGFPQLGGGGTGLHIAHVLWGGLLLGLAMVMLLSFAGPVIRPLAALVGGIGFGLFIDEVGKFLTSDNDYFFQPAPAVMYVTVVLLLVLGEAMHGRREHHPAEYLAGAADQAVSGIAGGFTPQARAEAERLLGLGRSAYGAPEVAALLRTVPHDPYELRDPIDVVSERLGRAASALGQLRWVVRALLTVLVLVAVTSFVDSIAAVVFGDADGTDSFANIAAATGNTVSGVLVISGLVVVRRDRRRAFRRFRWAVLLDLLLTQVFVLGTDVAYGALGVVIDLLFLAIIGGEQRRLEQLESEAARAGDIPEELSPGATA